MSNEINFDVLKDVTTGDKLVVRFKPEGSEDLIYVAAMVRAGVLTVSVPDQLFLEGVSMSNDWEDDNNRTQTLAVGPRWNRSFFEGRMGRALESLQVK